MKYYKIAQVRFYLYDHDIVREKPVKMFVDDINGKSKNEIYEMARKEICRLFPAFSETIKINSVFID